MALKQLYGRSRVNSRAQASLVTAPLRTCPALHITPLDVFSTYSLDTDSIKLTEHMPITPIPTPKLRFIFHLNCRVAEPRPIVTAAGIRKIIAIQSASLSSTSPGGMNGLTIINHAKFISGEDHLLLDSNDTARLDARYTFQLSSGRYMYFQSSGFRHSNDPETVDKLNTGLQVDNNKVYFMLRLILETDEPELAELARCIVIAKAERGPSCVRYDAYVVE